MTDPREPLAAAEQLRQEGLRAAGRGEPDTARTLFDAALAQAARAPDGSEARAVRAQVLVSASWITFERNGIHAGLPILDEALELLDGLDRPDLHLMAHLQAAAMHGRSGDLVSARTRMQVAEPIAESAPDFMRMKYLVTAGALAMSAADLDAAQRWFTAACELPDTPELAESRFRATHNLGYVAYFRGDLPEALALMARADDLARHLPRGIVALDRARVLIEAGLISEGEASLRSARAIAEGLGSGQDLGEVDLELARCALLHDDATTAASLARRAETAFRQRGSSLWRLQARLVAVQARLGRGDPLGAARLAGQMRVGCADTVPSVAERAALLESRALTQVAGASDQAAALYREVQALRHSPSLTARLECALVGAHLATRHGEPAEATRLLARAARDLERATAGVSSLELRSAVAWHARPLAALDIATALGSASPITIFDTVERWRALSARLPVLSPPDDPAEAGLTTQLRMLADRQRREPSIQRAAQIAKTQKHLRERAWTRSQDAAAGAVTSVPSVAEVTASGTVLVSFFVHDGRLLAVSLTPDDARRHDLGPHARICAAAGRLRADADATSLTPAGPFREVVLASLRRSAAALDDLLSEAIPADGPLVILPTGPLSALPWSLLPSLADRPLRVAPTARTGLQHSAIPHAAVEALGGPGLVHAPEEVRLVGEIWGAAPLPAANADDLLRALSQADIAHVAAHGSHEQESPLFSSILMSDGPVVAHEIASRQVRARHVVLSACDVGRATLRPGDEGLGLTASLLSLGVGSVLAAPVRVADEATTTLMTGYHRALRDGLRSDVALARAGAALPWWARVFALYGGTLVVSSV